MTEHRTDGVADLVAVVSETLAGWTADWEPPCLRIDGPAASTSLTVERRTSVTPSMAHRLAGELTAPAIIVADLIDSVARTTLERAGLSYWDRRGRLMLQTDDPVIRVNVDTASHVRGADGPSSDRPITGRAGIAVAVAACMWPDAPLGVRKVAGLARMSPSTVSEARNRLIEHGLLSSQGSPLLPELFWATSDVWVVNWRPTRTWSADDDWAQTGHGAAVRYGARTITGVPQAYVPDPQRLDLHLLRYPARDDVTPYLVAVPPTRLATTFETGVSRIDEPVFVHPVIAALDLSRDARGREVLTQWTSIDLAAVPSVFAGDQPQARPVWL